MAVLFVAGLAVVYAAERAGNPLLAEAPIDASPGSMEGKEVRFGVVNSALWAILDHGRLERLGQRHARQLHAARRARR